MKYICTRAILFVCLLGMPAVHGTAVAADALSGHGLLRAALKKHVQDGRVDYNAMATDGEFEKYLQWLADGDLPTLQSEVGVMAFWINAYNALAIKGVIDNMPLKRVIDVDGFFDKQTHMVAGQKLTLNQIEKGILVPKFKETRLHFVLVCAALSCPDLQADIYTSQTLDGKMTEVARRFINNPAKNRLDRKSKTLYLSQIFNWYKNDFAGEKGSLLEYVLPFLSESDREFLQTNDVEIAFLPYDWRLNAQER